MNEIIKESEYKSSKDNDKINYLTGVIKRSEADIKYWKEEYNRQKTWADDFKKLQ